MSEAHVQELKDSIPELPVAKALRYVCLLYTSYGADHVAQIVTFGTMAARAAIRDVGRVLDMPYGTVDGIALSLIHISMCIRDR